MTQQPSGWYADPTDPETLRYWDGVTWTNHTAPRATPSAAPQPVASSGQTVPLPQSAGPQAGTHPWPGQTYPGQQPYAPTAIPFAPTTADGVPLASWGQRLGAWIVDGLILFVPVQGLDSLLFASTQEAALDRALQDVQAGLEAGDTGAIWDAAGSAAGPLLLSALFMWALVSAYCIAFWMTTGQTIGKMAVGISVRSADRPGPLTFGESVKRRLVPLLGEVVPFLRILDGLWPLWDGRRQALHDKVAGTQVVVGKQPRRGSTP